MILLQDLNIKRFLQKATFQIGLKRFLLLRKLKILFRDHMLLVLLKVKKLLDFREKKIRVDKVIKRKSSKLYVIWTDYDNSFNSWIDKEDIA